jgi:hypothetical protein
MPYKNVCVACHRKEFFMATRTQEERDEEWKEISEQAAFVLKEIQAGATIKEALAAMKEKLADNDEEEEEED